MFTAPGYMKRQPISQFINTMERDFYLNNLLSIIS
jgi:hypothetical protein